MCFELYKLFMWRFTYGKRAYLVTGFYFINRAPEDSFDLLFCQDFKKTKNLREQMKSSESLVSIASFLKDDL